MRALLLSSLWLVACSSTVSASDGGAADVGVPDVSTVPVGSVLHIAAAGPNTCALRADGTVRCWGHYGVPGSIPQERVIATVQGLSDARQLAVTPGNGTMGYAVRATGEVAQWQRVVDHTIVPSIATPTGVLTPQRQVAVGASHACVLDDAGAVRCWGDNRMGQLGDGTYTARDTPTLVRGIGLAVEIAAAEVETCARLRDGTVWCWGRNHHGALGDGVARHGCAITEPADEDCSATPVRVAGITAATQISVGLNGACAVERGRALCWGWNTDGRLGDGTETDRATPTPVALGPGADVVSVFSGYLDGCVVRADGALWCWGIDYAEIPPDSGVQPRHAPAAITALGAVREVTGGWEHHCALKTDGTVWCWGLGGFGQLAREGVTRSEPVRVEGL